MSVKETVTEQDVYGFLEEYEEALPRMPITTGAEELHAWLSFVDMLCLVAIFQREQRVEELVDRVAAIPGDVALMRSLEPHEPAEFVAVDRIRGIYDDLVMGEAIADRSMLPIATMLSGGRMTHLEFLAFLLTLAFAGNRKYQRLYGILQGEKEETAHPTMALALDLGRFYLFEEERRMATLLNPDSFLNRFLLEDADPRRDAEALFLPLRLHRTALLFSRGQTLKLGDLNLCAQVLTPAADTDYVCFPKLSEELESVYASLLGTGKTGVIELCGEEGSGRTYLMRLLSADAEIPVIAVDMKKLLTLDGNRQRSMAKELVLHTVFAGALLLLQNVEEVQGAFPAAYFLSELQSAVDILFLSTKKPLTEDAAESLEGALYRLQVPEADFSAQLLLWTTFAREENVSFPEDLNLTELVSKYTMNPGRIRVALTNAILCAKKREDGCLIAKEDLEEQIRKICAVQFKETAKRLTSPFVWEDLKVDPRAEKLLRRVCDRVRYRKTVNDDFGFGKKLPYGRGLSVVLYGPPGTGKTMAAQVLAKELGLDIYRIDLSQISSKYIGETEKNLGAVFDAARNSNAILFFDEADSLFSKRTEVSSSHDKYANAETSYLLQKIEEYPGVSILATNNMQNFDAAFKRRITYMIPIEEPSEETRLLLWKNAFPKATPVSPEIDFRLLAQALTLTGSNIKSISVDVAFRAAAENREITYQDLVEAVDAECLKTGRMGAGTELQQAIIRGYREQD